MFYKLCNVGMTICWSIYSLGFGLVILFNSWAYCDNTTTTATGTGEIVTTTKSSQMPWDELRKSVAETAVITFFSFTVITALIGLVLYFARSRSALQNTLVDVISKNTTALNLLIDKLDKEHDVIQEHPCILLDSVHRKLVLKGIEDSVKEKK